MKNMHHWVVGVVLLAVAGGCSIDSSDNNASESVVDQATGQNSAASASEPAPAAEAPPAATQTLNQDSASSIFGGLGAVNWLHTDVSGWAQTAKMNVSFSGDMISLNYDKANVWPGRDGLNANPWIFVFQGGVWYGATWEWFRVGQTSKPKRVVAGDHIKVSPLNNFKPRSGEIYGFMVSGLARSSTRNVQERSNVDLVVWP
jgi:hypothetical protein